MVVSNLQICLSSPLPSFIVALFCAAAIFNRLVLHSHPLSSDRSESRERLKNVSKGLSVLHTFPADGVSNCVKHHSSEEPRPVKVVFETQDCKLNGIAVMLVFCRS